MLTSFIAAVFLEWIAIYLGPWEYNSNMPTLSIDYHQIGILPILQITFIPALSVCIASKQQFLKNYNYRLTLDHGTGLIFEVNDNR